MTYTTMQPQVPGDVDHLARTYQLGYLGGVYDKPKLMRLLIPLWVVAIVMILAGLTAAGSTNMDTAVVFYVLFIALPIAGSIWGAMQSPVFSRKARASKIYAYSEGFVQVTRKGAAAHRWDSVAALYQMIVRQHTNGIYTGTNYRYKFIYTDGSESKMTHFTADMSVLGDVIMERVTSAQVPGAVAGIRQGQTYAFGDINLSAHGIGTTGKPLVPWTQIARIDVSRGYVKVVQPGKRTTLVSRQCAKVPNLGTFLYVSQRLAGGRRL